MYGIYEWGTCEVKELDNDLMIIRQKPSPKTDLHHKSGHSNFLSKECSCRCHLQSRHHFDKNQWLILRKELTQLV